MKKKLAFLFLCCMILSSCIVNMSAYTFLPFPEDFTEVETETYLRPKEYTDNFQDVYQDYRDGKFANLASEGEQKILVIPVEFSDYSCTKNRNGCEDSRAILHNTFFGNPASTTWNSVASYYNKSSYGRLQITGKVTPWFKLGETTNELMLKLWKQSKESITNEILQKAVEWYKTQYDDIMDYDTDNDGYIDAVWLVYYNDMLETSSLFWAYSFWDYTKRPSVGNPIGNAYAWAGYNFLNLSNSSNFPDAHVFIHETGHLLGLSDYYSTVEDDPANPIGKIDMMDYGVGDHNAFSKMLLGWTMPYVVKDSGKITIKPFESSGDCIVIPRKWTGKVMDEYLLIEFYTPTGLNEKDAKAKYQNLSNYKKPGIKVYQVDARVGLKVNIGGEILGYLEDKTEEDLEWLRINRPFHYKIVNTNSSDTYDGNLLLKLLESSGKDTFSQGEGASDETLFHQGDDFGVTTFKDLTFHDGQKIEFVFVISKMDNESAEITFIRKQI